MDPMDSRRLDRTLGDRGDVVGGPRKPAELLDQLRQRLERLADNHPSSVHEPVRADGGRLDPRPDGGQSDPRAERDCRVGAADSPDARDDSNDQAELASGNELDERRDATAQAGVVRAGAAEADAAQADSEPGKAEGEPVSADAQDEWWFGGADHAGGAWAGRLGDPLDLGGDGAQAYLPWFASPEEGTPWFITEPGQSG